jgi:hypothetical protein
MSSQSASPDQDRAYSFDSVAEAELDDISARRMERGEAGIEPDPNARHRACTARLFGLCISGGGIRSATFGLGILQGLVEKSLLQRADFLSTVSGGGYIGAWLQGVLYRTGSFDALDPRRLDGRQEPPSVYFLRKYSNYLAPRPGLSLDSAVIPVIWTRNAGLNQIIIAAASFAVILLGYLPGYLLSLDFSGHAWLAFVAAAVLALTAALFAGSNLKDVVEAEFMRESYCDRCDPPARIGSGVVLPLVLGASALVAGSFKISLGWSSLVLWLVLFLLHAGLQWLGGFPYCYQANHPGIRFREFRTYWHIVWMSLAGGGLAYALICAVGFLIGKWAQAGIQGAYEAVAWGPPLVLLSLFVGLGVQLGLMGRDYPDAAREWLARSGAWVAVCAVGWAAILTLAIFSPWWLMTWWAASHAPVLSAAAAWIASTIGGVLAGKSSATAQPGEKTSASRGLDLIARYAPLVALPGFFMAIAYAVHAALFWAYLVYPPPGFSGSYFMAAMQREYWRVLSYSGSLILPIAMFVVAVAIFVVLSLRVNINEFSMHHFYKNRLVRCYLGASAADSRKPNRFTGFDPHDDVPLSSLSCVGKPEGAKLHGPFPILSATLTVTQGSELASQERKAKSWFFTPLYSGFTPERTAADRKAKDEQSLSLDGYRRTDDLLGGQLHIGTAMAISGAALNPGQGFHTSTQVAFLLTLFDVRLGWWIGNPRNRKTYTRPGPLIAAGPLVRELFGLLDERSPYLNLSDGGNFDNLGLYELVRRGCRFIVAVDAEEDQDFEFNALGAAVRKCRDDFQVEIDINPHAMRPVGDYSGAHCVVGRIAYPDEAERGYLLYIKASMTGDEPADVELYRRQFPAFPQQSTADQFFTESQFESYRRLGLHSVRTAFDFNVAPGLDQVFERLADRWELPPGPPAGNASAQAEAYTKLLDAWRQSGDVIDFDADIVEDRPQEFTAHNSRARYFLILDLIQLMESIFLDCNLSQSQNREHRAYAGWMRVFRYWLRQESVRKVWETQRGNYARSFTYFVDDCIHEASTRFEPRT